MPGRAFLMLQGVCSPFFTELACGLRRAGHQVEKVSFNAGDVLCWGAQPSWLFRGAVEQLPEFLDEHCRRLERGVTDQILFGDCRPVHRRAIAWGEARGIRTHVFEEGYFRPYWVTLERGGVNGRSSLPRDPRWYREIGARLRDDARDEAFASPFFDRARHDVLYHAAGLINPLLFPRYRTHAPVSAGVEYAGYVRRFARLACRRADARVRCERLLGSTAPYFFLPLQLDADAQIREHSPFADMRAVLDTVMKSFARAAPIPARLVVKAHPLDPGLVDHAHTVRSLERRYALAGRTEYLESGDLESLVRGARGVVTVNSTVGLVALEAGRPTKTLASPVYDLDGLTCRGSLDEFWRAPAPPDASLFRYFRKTLMRGTQVNGGFYSRRGIELAVRNCEARLSAERSPLDMLQ